MDRKARAGGAGTSLPNLRARGCGTAAQSATRHSSSYSSADALFLACKAYMVVVGGECKISLTHPQAIRKKKKKYFLHPAPSL